MSDSSNPCWRLAPAVSATRTRAHTPGTQAASSVENDTVTLTWCACELCNSVGPRFMTLVKNHREYTVELSSRCCNPGVEYTLVSGEQQRAAPRYQMRC
jgi:hypothetical protein